MDDFLHIRTGETQMAPFPEPSHVPIENIGRDQAAR
jgi:hypothetical protein